MVDWKSVGRTVFDKAAPELSRLYSAKQEGKLGETILAKAFPEMYSNVKKYRSFRDAKKGPRDTSEIGESLSNLSQVMVDQNQAISQNASMISQQNEILIGILQELRDIKSQSNSFDPTDLLDLGGKGKPKPKGPVKPKEGYRYDERTGRYHDSKTGKMVTQEAATGVPKEPAVKGPAEKVNAPKVGEVAAPSVGGRVASGAMKGLGIAAAAYAIYEAWKEIDALDVNDPDFKKKVTKIVTNSVAQFGLATVGAVLGTLLGTAVFPGIGTIIGIVAGIAGGVAAQFAFGDSVESLVDYIVDKLFELKAPKPTGQTLVAPGESVRKEETKSTEDGKLAEDGVFGTVEYSASEIEFEADTMTIEADEVTLSGADQLSEMVQEGTTQLGVPPSGAEKPEGRGEGGKPPAESEVNKNLNLETITSKGGRSTKVESAYKSNFQGFIDELESTGYEIKDLGGYAYRPNVNNPSVLSYHSFGAAIDINPLTNPNGTRKTDMPSETVGIAEKYGLGWGMNFSSTPDPMHFSIARAEGGSVPLSRTGQKVESYGSTGKTNKSGPAVVGDARASRSNAEVVMPPGGGSFLAKKPTVMDLAKGTKVMNMEQAKDLITSPQGMFNIASGLAGMIPGAQQVIAGAKTVGAVGTNLAKGNVRGAIKEGLIEASAAIPDPTGLASTAIEYGLDQAMPDRPAYSAPQKTAPKKSPPQKSKNSKSSTELLAMSVSGT